MLDVFIFLYINKYVFSLLGGDTSISMDKFLKLSEEEQLRAIADRQYDDQMRADAIEANSRLRSVTEKEKGFINAFSKQLHADPGLRAATTAEAAQADREEAAAKAAAAKAAKAEAEAAVNDDSGKSSGGRRRRHSKSKKGNSWLAHVKATMKDKKNKGKAYKQILKIAKKTYKKSQSQSGGKRRKCKTGGSTMKNYQNGGSGGKMDGVGQYATPV